MSGFHAVFHITEGPLFGDPQTLLQDESEARNFNISALRGRNRRCNVKGEISGGIEGLFCLDKASILWTKYY